MHIALYVISESEELSGETEQTNRIQCYMHNLPPTTEEIYLFVHAPAFVCLSVCKITQKRVHRSDEMLRVNRCRDMDELINF